MRYLIIESATGEELGDIDTDADEAVDDLFEAGWLTDGNPDDYAVDESHPMAEPGSLVILGPDMPELLLEPVEEEYDDEGEDEGDE